LDFGWEPYRVVSQPAAFGAPPDVFPTHADPQDPTNPNKRAVRPITVHVDDKDITINPDRAPYFTLNGHQFNGEEYAQTMVLGDSEEWKIINTTGIRHPFHIHVNPFQVVEVFDPNDASNCYTAEKDGIWQDVILIPAAKTWYNKDTFTDELLVNEKGGAQQAGFVRIRSRYVDFTGDFVLHCHLLTHEDRGMMQLVRVISKTSVLQHH
jgi:FtsP/CotA-like multicopper oxidase with cupredoxin domain